MRLRLGTAEHDLTTQALVIGVLGVGGAPVFDLDERVPLDTLLKQADAVVADGADVLDVGGVPAGPGPPVGEEEELDRLVPAVQALRARFDTPVAIETWRAAVLREACAAGAAVGHDSSGFADPAFLAAAHGAGATVVARHTRLPTAATPQAASDVVGEVRAFLAERVRRARAEGIPDERIVVDAGLDIGKSPAQSLTLLRESAVLADLGPPLMLDASDKRFLGTLLDLDPGERRMASHAAAALGIARGCRLVRAHDVRGARRVVDVLAALLEARLTHVGAGADEGRHDA